MAGERKTFSAKSDFVHRGVLYGVSGLFAVICIVFLLSVIVSSIPAWKHSGFSLIYGRTWSQGTDSFGALPIIAGTLATTVIALILAVPIGLGSALAIVHLLPQKLRLVASSLVELLAAVPSVVYGLWGLLVLAPWFESTVEPDLADITARHWPFDPPYEGVGLLLAGCVLFVMILPMIVALSRDAIAIVPREQYEGALSVGATKWQVLSKVVLPAAKTGIVGAVTLATARALGETVAVALGVKDQAELWFQERRGAKITEIAEQYDKMVAARDEAERIARLGGPTGRRDGVRMAPGPGGIVRPGA